MIRTPELLAELWEKASKEQPLTISTAEGENFSKAMKLLQAVYNSNNKVKTVIFDKDHLLKDGVKSMADGKMYSNRREYNECLKRHGMVEVGDQAKVETNREIRGDFNLKNDLKKALEGRI